MKYNSYSKWLQGSLILFLAFVLPGIAAGSTPAFPGDLNGDGGVTWDDMGLFSLSWLVNDCNDSLDADCDVDFGDYAILALDWLKGLPEFRGLTYYVATDGNDLNPGTSALPWKTIQKAANTMVAGDMVIVRPGTYNEMVTVPTSGSSQGCGIGDLPITYLADPSGDVIVNATGLTRGFSIGKSWVIIDGFKITGATADGIRFDTDGPSYDIIRNCKIYGNGNDGIEVWRRDNVTIENCIFYGNVDTGVKSTTTSAALQVKKCIMYGNANGLNLVGNGNIKDCIITNNTTNGIQSDLNHTVTYCDVWGNGTDYTGGVSAGTGCISDDPCFVNPVTDFHLLADSPCIGAASEGEDMGYKHLPMANAGPDQTYYANELATFDGSASKGSIISYAWDFNDTDTGSGKIATHTYTTAGTYTVSLDVNDGNSTDADTCMVEVLPARPTETVYHVTNLDGNNVTGGFANCLYQANNDSGASRIVFDVNGTIHSPVYKNLTANNTTICGTEAPGNGITFDFDGLSGGFSINGDNCRMCNITITNTKLLPNGTDGINVDGHNNVLERVTATYCTDEGIGVTSGYGHIVAFCYIRNCGSITDQGNGRGLAVWYGASATVVGNFIADNLRGLLLGGYNTGSFVDFRNNFVYSNDQTYGINIDGTNCTANFIDNLTTSNPVGIKYVNTPTVYKSGNTINDGETGSYTAASQIITQTNTPFPNWLNNATTPTSSTSPGVGMGTGKCQCVLCE